MCKFMCRGKEIFPLFSFRMGILHLAIVKVIISLSPLLSVAVLYDLGYSIEKYDESPGIYYEDKWGRSIVQYRMEDCCVC